MSKAPLLMLILLLTGCATRELPPISIYTLQIEPAPPGKTSHPGNEIQKPTLTLGNLHSGRPFATTQMLYTKTGLDQNSFAYSRWSDSPVALLQQLFGEELSRSNLFKTVLPTNATARSGLALEGNLLDFSLHLEGEQPAAVLEIRFLLLDKHHGQVLANRLFQSRVTVTEASPANTAQALEQAARQVAHRLLTWLQRHH